MAKRQLTPDEKVAARKKLVDALRAKDPDRIIHVEVEDETSDSGEPLYKILVMKEGEDGGRGDA